MKIRLHHTSSRSDTHAQPAGRAAHDVAFRCMRHSCGTSDAGDAGTCNGSGTAIDKSKETVVLGSLSCNETIGTPAVKCKCRKISAGEATCCFVIAGGQKGVDPLRLPQQVQWVLAPQSLQPLPQLPEPQHPDTPSKLPPHPDTFPMCGSEPCSGNTGECNAGTAFVSTETKLPAAMNTTAWSSIGGN